MLLVAIGCLHDVSRAGSTVLKRSVKWILSIPLLLVAMVKIAVAYNNYFILGVDYVKPFQRPDKGWHLQFNVTPGF